MAKSTKQARRRRKIPTRKEIQLHLKRNARTQRILKRLVKDLEKARKDLLDGGKPGSGHVAKEIDWIDVMIATLSALWETIKACNKIHEAMSSTMDALDSPGVPQGTKDQLNENLGSLIESAANLGCP